MTKSEGRRLDGGEREDNRESDQSPGIIFEKFLTYQQKMTANKERSLAAAVHSQRHDLENIADSEVEFLRSQDIKIEENISDQSLTMANSHNKRSANRQVQHHHDIRSVLVKQESSLVNDIQATEGSRHIRWNVEQVETENASNPIVDSEETTQESTVTSDYNSNQCIFYPVKEEEREHLLGTSHNNCGSSATGTSSDGHTEHQSDSQPSDEGSLTTQDYQDTGARGLLPGPGVNDFADVQGEAETECQQTPELRDFLLQSSHEEVVGTFEMADLHIESEAEIMTFLSKNQISNLQQTDQLLQSSAIATSHQPMEEIKNREPIEYFSKYFDRDTWVEIAWYTNTLSNMVNPVTAREVGQFVGIHIAMGTLKFPSPKLYWEDLTKVPLIAEAMPMSRFIQLSHALKLASPVNEPANSKAAGEMHNFENVEVVPAHIAVNNKSKHSESSQFGDSQQQRDKADSLNSSRISTDPLWKVQPVLCRFHAGCQSLRKEGDYAVDQYTLPLTGKAHSHKNSLYCTTLIGFGGLLLHVDLKLDLSEKDAVEKMVPKGSTVFLCKQELSTPAMLERLLVAGVHGAGRVGGARGQIGDEFVSSDGRLMLRRSHCGFILSTAGNGQRNMVSLIDSFEKAQMSVRLNRDLQNLYCIPLTTSAPACWPQAVLWYLTDLALVNSWLLYRQDHGASAPLTLMAFRLEVSKALILSSGTDTQDSVPPQPPTEKPQAANEIPSPSLLQENPLPDETIRYDGSGHWPEQLSEGEGGRCRFGDCQRTSRVLCLKCCVFLCISRNHNCFINFHHQGSL
ncbi:uncharacterized protein LOC117514593 [Thalassophryne amazonica]|uniref:uncharacterized protein LOC117514593 n=1 Tax=Thalassophryne amazonica TaxID=390379 RepID=UPI001470D407|nr:uncharacterized protein LOC117514593 [Thalassophryne amazonica]